MAIDATPLLGTRTGVGRFCEGALQGLAPHTELEVDGGVDASNAAACAAAGATVLVAGTAVFGHADGPAAGVRAITATLRPA